jgi:plastocyanin
VAAAVALGAIAVWPPAAGTHSGHGPTFVSISQLKFSPSNAAINTGDEVIWAWDGPDRNHSVTADDGSFDSDPGRTSGIEHSEADAFAQQFDNPGTFAYHCKVHGFMRGTVTVTGQPLAEDKVPPGISNLRAKPGRRTALVRLTLSEGADFTIRIRRGSRTALTRRFSAGQGESRVRMPIAKLRPGRYTVLATAKDRAGNASEPARAAMRIR